MSEVGKVNGAIIVDDYGHHPTEVRATLQAIREKWLLAHAESVQLIDRCLVALNPPPSLGGLLVGFGLRLLDAVPPAVWADETATLCHLLACMAVTQAVREQVVDAAAKNGSGALTHLPKALLSDTFVDGWREPFLKAAAEGPPKTGLLFSA